MNHPHNLSPLWLRSLLGLALACGCSPDVLNPLQEREAAPEGCLTCAPDACGLVYDPCAASTLSCGTCDPGSICVGGVCRADTEEEEEQEEDPADPIDPEYPPSVNRYTVSQYELVYDAHRYTELNADEMHYSPTGLQSFHDDARSTLYLSDHIGVRAYRLDRLERAEQQGIELLEVGFNPYQCYPNLFDPEDDPNPPNSPCCYHDYEEDFVSRCISYTGGVRRPPALLVGGVTSPGRRRSWGRRSRLECAAGA